jgi:uncharacterized protein YbjT (DUF2867 family)
MADLQLRIIRTLRRSGIKIVKLSGTSTAITPDGPYACREHWEIEQVLAGSDQPYVILRPNAFMQTLIDRGDPERDRDGRHQLGAGGAGGLSAPGGRRRGRLIQLCGRR